MFKANPQLATGIKQLLERMATMKRGDLLPHVLIADLSGIPYESERWGTFCAKLRRKVTKELKFVLVPVPTVGYRIAGLNDQINDAYGRGKRASRQLFRGQKEISAAPDDDCSDYQRKIKTARLQLSKAGRSMLRKAEHINAALTKNTEQLPRRKSA